MRLVIRTGLLAIAFVGVTYCQHIPDVQCPVEEYPMKSVAAWQFPHVLDKVQVVVLRDPAGEQEARFDLLHGASLISLRYHGRELFFGQSAGASVSLFSVRHSSEAELKHLPPYWSAYSPDQGGSSMGVPATTTGVACKGASSMRAFAMMIDRGVDNSFQRNALLGVFAGHVSQNFPPGYSTPFVIETNASWIQNKSGSPAYYLKLEQSVVNTGNGPSGPLEWYLNAATPWDFQDVAHYPANCDVKTPCATAKTPVIAAGRYQDSSHTDGVAVVVPTAGWRSKRAYIRDNAEYVVLLYGAVWAAPRRTFAAVLEHPLDGSQAFHFAWYVCAGDWKASQTFAASQARPDTASEDESSVPPEADQPAAPADEIAVRVSCEVTTFQPQPDQKDDAVVLEDPAGEQRVLFDTTQGGAIVSLRYQGREHVWGYNGGGLLQMAFHNRMTNGAWTGDYNPTQAGDGSAMSPVTGIACDGSRRLRLNTMMLDFNHNNGFYERPLIAVWGGRVNDMVPLSYSTPYLLETDATWVRNPAGVPTYYLSLKQRLVHVADEKIGRFSFDFADYQPWEYAVRASYFDGHTAVGGWYEDGKREAGMAVGMSGAAFPGAKTGGGFNSDYMWRNRSFHLTADASLDGIAEKEFRWYVMAGTWRNALEFSKSFGQSAYTN